MVPVPRSFQKWIPYLDWYDVGFVVIVFGLAGFGIYLTGDSAGIALVTAVTASVGIYRLRKPDDPKRPAVRQAFEPEKNGEKDFGRRNYGPGPALYLKVEAGLEIPADSEGFLFKLEPLHYEQKEDNEEIFKQLRKHTKKPRKMNLEEIREHCLQKTDGPRETKVSR